MINQEKKNHHFVPQVYLRKFANSREKKGKKNHFFVSTYDKIDNSELIKTDIEKICRKTKLYTIESPDIQKRESVENLYASTIEQDYNKFYDLITNENIINLSLEDREMIIVTIISMYFRNVFWYNTFNNFWTGLIKRYDYSEPINIYSENGEVLFPFETQTIDEITAFQKKENKQAFIQEHLRWTINLVKSHFSDIIIVESDKSQSGFITSDKPVICANIASSFSLPINNDYILRIMPNTENVGYNPKKIIRNFPFTNKRLYNVLQYENAERLVIGKNINDIRLSKADYINAISKTPK